MKKKLWNEKKYNKILNEVGEGRYQILYPDDSFISDIFTNLPGSLQDRFTCACITTSATTAIATVDYKCEGFIIPKGSHVINWRTFRYCEHDRNPHFNADDNIICPDDKGNIWKVSRDDSPDHYISIATWAGLQHIADAYYLPTEPNGPYLQYIENGATVPIKFIRVEKEK